jgi:hypothetical protein
MSKKAKANETVFVWKEQPYPSHKVQLDRGLGLTINVTPSVKKAVPKAQKDAVDEYLKALGKAVEAVPKDGIISIPLDHIAVVLKAGGAIVKAGKVLAAKVPGGLFNLRIEIPYTNIEAACVQKKGRWIIMGKECIGGGSWKKSWSTCTAAQVATHIKEFANPKLKKLRDNLRAMEKDPSKGKRKGAKGK